jgi:transcriptional regulator with XRE-family HTH domain
MRTRTAKKRTTLFANVQVEIGVAIKELRTQAGYESANDFARRFDLPEIQYWRIERGKANLTLKSIHKILEIHRVDFFRFFGAIEKKINS